MADNVNKLHILDLPGEMLREISFFLNLEQVKRLRLCCKRFQDWLPISLVKKRRKSVNLDFIEENFHRLTRGDLKSRCPDLLIHLTSQSGKEEQHHNLLTKLRHRVVSLPSVDIPDLERLDNADIQFPNLEVFSYSHIVYKKPFLGVNFPYYSKEEKWVNIPMLSRFLMPCADVLTTLYLENIDLGSLKTCKFTSLRNLTLYRCSHTESLLNILFNCVKSLEELKLKDNNSIDWKEFEKELTGNPSMLSFDKMKKLNISVSEVAREFFRETFPEAHKLPRSMFSLCPFVEELSLTGLTLYKVVVDQKLSSLKHLVLTECQVYEKLPSLLAVSHQTLQSLALKNCKRSTNLAEESDHAQWDNVNIMSLRRFDIENKSEPDQYLIQIWSSILRLSSSTLHELDISLPNIPSFDVKLTTLKSLHLQLRRHGNTKVNVPGVVDLVCSSAATLETLKTNCADLIEGDLVSETGFVNLKVLDCSMNAPSPQLLENVASTLENLVIPSTQDVKLDDSLQFDRLTNLEVKRSKGLALFLNRCVTLQRVALNERNLKVFNDLTIDLPTLKTFEIKESLIALSDEEIESFKSRCPNGKIVHRNKNGGIVIEYSNELDGGHCALKEACIDS